MNRTSLGFTRRLATIIPLLLSPCLCLLGATSGWAADSDSVWIEGENTTSVDPAGTKTTIESGPTNVLSDGKWLKVAIDAGAVNAAVPDTGIVLSYAAQVTSAADYDVWVHVGFEQVRAPFDWQIDQGPWQTVNNTEYTTDVQEIGVWAPVAWLKLGRQNLTAGSHTLQFRINKSKSVDGKIAPVIFALDSIYLSAKPFHPDGVIKPGDTSWMNEADKAAASQTFAVPTVATAAQTPVSLAGAWQYAPDDELQVDDRLGPVKSLPDLSTLTWHGLTVPGDRNAEMPDQKYVHRYYLRTRVQVPAELAGHSFVLNVPAESLVATVFVNGQQMGWTKNCWAAWDCDVSNAIKAGQVNEICVAFKDVFYGLYDDANVKHPRYVPFEFWHFHQTRSLDMPVLGLYATGFVLNAPALTVGGQAYSADVFAKPSVKNKTLGLEITLHNSTAQTVTAQLTNEIQPLAGGPAEKTFAPQTVTLPAGQDTVVQLSEPWTNPKLWWTDDPQQYNVVTRLAVADKVIDERSTKFGFREWTWDGNNFALNGIPFHGFADCETTSIENLQSHGERMLRVWTPTDKTAALLDECDAKGMAVRRTGIFDGEGAAGFYAIKDNPSLWDNYRQQLLAWAKGQRNHPSIFIWSMENEISFINGHVFGLDAITTQEMKKAADLLMTLDPTRPVMTDGGNANLDESLPVYGGHYMEPPFNTFPESCYDRAAFANRQSWPVTKAKPVLLGESAFIAGDSLGDLATVGGERAFLGKGEAKPGVALILRMLSEGYRWNDVNFTFWTAGQIPTYYKAWQPVAVLCRQWDWTFGSGEQVTRTLGIFNDTRSTDPITLNWTLAVDGKSAGSGTSTHNVAPGQNEKFDMTLPVPTVEKRQEGVLTLTLTSGGKTVFEDTKDISILPPPSVTLTEVGSPQAGQLAVFDPKGSVTEFLNQLKIPFTPVTDLKQAPKTAHVLLVGNDALDAATSTSSQLAAWASNDNGHSVIVLEQENPLKFQGLPSDMATAVNDGCLAFLDDSTHPALNGLQNKDFSTWGPDGYLYTNAYVKPGSGGKSLLQCDSSLADSALVEMTAGKGTMLLSQLLVGSKIKTNAVAQKVLLNLLAYAGQYKQTFVDTSVVADDNGPLLKALDATGLKYDKSADPLAALDKAGSIAVINASPAHLKPLADNLAKVNAFTQAGGWIILNNLTPDGLADYNRLVGVEHLIRPFKREKITWPAVRNR